MPRIFVSYSRSDKKKVDKLIPLLKEQFGDENVWWDQNFYGGQVWWQEILEQIAKCDIFIYLMSKRSLSSPYCLAELEEARRIHKAIIPVKFRPNTRVPDSLSELHWVNLSGMVNRRTLVPLTRAINEQPHRLSSRKKPLSETPVSFPEVPTEKPERYLQDYTAQILIGLFVTVVGGLILASISRPNSSNQTVLMLPTREANLEIPTEGNGDFIDQINTPGISNTDLPIDQPTRTNTSVPTNSTTPTSQPTDTPVLSATPDLAATALEEVVQAELNALAVAATETEMAGWTPTPTTDTLGTAQARLDMTATREYIAENIEEFAQTPQPSNVGWAPFIAEATFNGFTMVLVPAGCFDMGSESGDSDERPVHQVCFDAPFWIDKYEVTIEQFVGAGDSSENVADRRPVINVNWFDARDFCEARQARLPTEAEWEYAARGPDSFTYPWGFGYDTNLVADGSSTMIVGSFPTGASWVGALDMSGNVWEWTSSLYEDYPYDEADGREDPENSSSVRVVRGGSFYGTSNSLRAASRLRDLPNDVSSNVGFRCVRPPSL